MSWAKLSRAKHSTVIRTYEEVTQSKAKNKKKKKKLTNKTKSKRIESLAVWQNQRYAFRPCSIFYVLWGKSTSVCYICTHIHSSELKLCVCAVVVHFALANMFWCFITVSRSWFGEKKAPKCESIVQLMRCRHSQRNRDIYVYYTKSYTKTLTPSNKPCPFGSWFCARSFLFFQEKGENKPKFSVISVLFQLICIYNAFDNRPCRRCRCLIVFIVYSLK